MSADAGLGARPARESARVAQVGYTAVIDRMTPALTLADVASNVARSVGGAGGTPATLPALWRPSWRQGAVSVFDEHLMTGPFDHEGTVSFGISVVVDGEPGDVAATAILHEPSARLRADAAALSDALHGVLEQIGGGVAAASLARTFDERTAEISVPTAALVAVRRSGAGVVPVVGAGTTRDATVENDDVLRIGALVRTTAGALVYQTTVHVTGGGAERLDDVPLRLIELR
jgi:hypothetical protein